MDKISDLCKSILSLLPFGKKKSAVDVIQEELDEEDREFASAIDMQPVQEQKPPALSSVLTPPEPQAPKPAVFHAAAPTAPPEPPQAPVMQKAEGSENTELLTEAPAKETIADRLRRFSIPVKKDKPKAEKEPVKTKKAKKKVSKKKKNPLSGFSAAKAGQVLVLLVMLGMFFGMAYFVLGGSNSSESVEPVENNSSSASTDDGREMLSDTDPVFQNPFVEVAGLSKAEIGPDGKPVLPAMKEAQNKVTPRASSPYVPSASYSSGVLPAIPYRGSAPSMPSFTPPAMPQAPSASAPAASAPAKPRGGISGVLTGEDGNNMAIMNDGTVVSQGETYNDNRIAYIGGDGIRFEDGTSIPYNP